MKDTFNELIQFSPFGGQLILEDVKGNTSGKINPENNVVTAIGADRDMYVYIPSTGCPHAKQTQVLMVLRDRNTLESAELLMKELALDRLAEENHFILLFPNPVNDGWNVQEDESKDNDIQYLARCFAALPKSNGKVSGFNGLMFFIGTTPASSAMVTTLAIKSPLDAAAIMVTGFPKTYRFPESKGAEQVAWIYGDNESLENYLSKVDNTTLMTQSSDITVHVNPQNECVRFYRSINDLSAVEVEKAWEMMFSETRRWRNDTFGTYQPRIDFTAKGFVKHFEDDSLGVNNRFRHTWYEYVPAHLRGRSEKVPLVLYFHGINCIGLYGAEQSGFASIADKENFIVVFPDPAIEERWNVWDDPRLPSDVDYVMALIDRLKRIYPIDETRIYISGFSMGSMFTNALACSYPDVFAAAFAFNGPHVGYLSTLDTSRNGMAQFRPNTVINDLPIWDKATSPIRDLADQKKTQYDYRMPFVQFVGLLDGAGFNPGRIWPVIDQNDGSWPTGLTYWKKFNNIQQDNVFGQNDITGIASPSCVKEGDRFIHQVWYSADENNDSLYHLISVERMPHAVDLKGFEIGWNIVKNYSRNSDGSITKREGAL